MNYGNNLTAELQDQNYPQNNDVKLFNVTTIYYSNAKRSSKNKNCGCRTCNSSKLLNSVQILINNTIQSSTGQASSANVSANKITSTLTISGDTSYLGFGVAQGTLVGFLSQYQQGIVTAITGAQPVQYINTSVQSVAGTTSFTEFDFLAPGMMVFAILLLATTVAAILTREVESGTLLRLKISKMRSFDLLFGGLIPWSLVAGAQVVILLIVAIILGLKWQGSVYSILLAIVIGIIAGIASISLAMIIASFAKNDRQAANLGTLIVVPTAFITGSFFPLPAEYVTLLGHTFQIYDILPWTHTLTALRSVLVYGSGWNVVSSDVIISAILALILFVIGVFLFSKTRLGAEN